MDSLLDNQSSTDADAVTDLRDVKFLSVLSRELGLVEPFDPVLWTPAVMRDCYDLDFRVNKAVYDFVGEPPNRILVSPVSK